jgi:glycerol-3-phosphate dehydrogenase
LTFPRVEDPSPFLAGEVTERIWPCVGLQWEWLGGLPPLRTAAVVGAGCMGTAAAVVLARAGLDVQLGCRTAAQAERLAAERENTEYLPGVTLDKAIRCRTVPEIEFAGVDLVATAIAEGSRNRRAGEMVGAGVPAGQVEAAMQQTAESLATVPLLSEAFARQGIEAPVTTGLRRVLDGEASPEQWLESVRSAKPKRRTRAA